MFIAPAYLNLSLHPDGVVVDTPFGFFRLSEKGGAQRRRFLAQLIIHLFRIYCET